MKRLIGGIAAAGLLAVSALVASAAPTTEVITEDDIVRQAHGTTPTNAWVLYTRDMGTGTFISGPAAPPLGNGSLRLTTTTANDKVYLFNYEHIGTALDDITAISYATYRSAKLNASQVAALNLQIDYNGPAAGGFATLVYEPVYDHGAAALLDNTWQTWDALKAGAAKWWSPQSIPGVCAFDCFVPWSTILAMNPDAVVLGGFGVNQGGGNDGLTSSVDALTIAHGGDTFVYNFEQYESPATQDDCKKGGWQTLKRANGTGFKNQGDCIQYVNTGK